MDQEDGRADRLIRAGAQQIAERGLSEASARVIAAAAGASPSAINYNFGNLEQLLVAAFDHGAAQGAAWLGARKAELGGLPKGPAAAAFLVERVASEWTQGARPLALLYQEQLASGLGGVGWSQAWRGFWLDAAAALGLSEPDGRLLHVLFESEALYNLSNWSPLLEAAALRDVCGHFGAVWLGADPARPLGALAAAEAAAGARVPMTPPPMEARLAEAAAEVVEAKGLGGLTHRAVAAQAGVTTGAVTHYFRTIESLVAGAIRGQVLAMSTRGAATTGPADIETLEAFLQLARDNAAGPPPPIDPALRRRRLFFAAVRRPDLAAAGAVIRFAHGGTAREVLARVAPGRSDVVLDAGVLSRLLASLRFACAADPDPPSARAALADEICDRALRAWG